MLLVTLDTTNEFADYFTGTFSLALQKVKDIAELKYEHEFITVRVDIPVTKAKAWEVFIHPDHIMEWNHAGEDWRCPAATNDLRVGGKFVYRMEPKRGKDGFNFTGTYTAVDRFELIAYELGDGRKVVVRFIERGDTICVFESFHPEAVHPRIAQRGGWQMIMDNYAKQSTS
ncbi:MAG: SRPBCC domain-containing protein [Ignavibacteria bacterium]|nr:SRPBCC domain-containing protein [Ignavibacteria bacterium]